jgi:hypothetical protein
MQESSSAIEFISNFSMMATIKKMETFDSKGGGLGIKIETSEVEKAIDVLHAKGNVCRITVEVSKARVIEPEEEAELDFNDIDPDAQ